MLSVTTPGLTLALRDQATSTRGAAAQDAVIGFDADGDGAIDLNHSGFSSFFGLNDFFVDQQGAGTARDGVSSSIAVRADIAASPALVTRGTVQWDGSGVSGGGYALSSGWHQR